MPISEIGEFQLNPARRSGIILVATPGTSIVVKSLISQVMPLEPPDQQYWQSAVGYVELSMFEDANDQLEKIDPFNRATPEVLAVRIAIYHGLKKWALMREIAKRLAEFQPNDVQWIISYAYATRRAESINAAKVLLLNAQSPGGRSIKYFY